MKKSEWIADRLQKLRDVMRMSKATRALETERTYMGWMRRYLDFALSEPDCLTTPPAEMARRYVAANADHWAIATQDQFRNALVFYYKHVAQKPLGDLGPWAQAKRPKHLPVWLPDAEMKALLSHLRGLPKLMGELDYGCGARSQELVKLRVKDIDFSTLQITIRSGKGDKDRTTILPATLADRLREQIASMRVLWEADRRMGRPGVEVPSTKFDGTDWAWFWLFAANHESRDPRSGIVRRHHVHKSTLGKAISAAVPRWGGNQRVTVHSLRHSFATALLMDGTPIHEVQALLGHSHISTTEIYLHVLPRLTGRVRSPMDRETSPSKVVPFHTTPIPRIAASA